MPNGLAKSIVNGIEAMVSKKPTMPNVLLKIILKTYANKVQCFTNPGDWSFYCFNASA